MRGVQARAGRKLRLTNQGTPRSGTRETQLYGWAGDGHKKGAAGLDGMGVVGSLSRPSYTA